MQITEHCYNGRNNKYAKQIHVNGADNTDIDEKEFRAVPLDENTPEGRKALEIFGYSIPEEERVDRKLFRSMMPESYDLVEWTLMDSDRAVGYCTFIKTPGAIFGLYLAIDSELRGKGYGSKTMKMMFKPGTPAFFGVETPDESAPNNWQRLSRIELYERLGFRMAGINMKNRFNGVCTSIMWNAETEEEKKMLSDTVRDMMVKGGVYEIIGS